MVKSLHDKIAEKIARKLGTEYKPHKGIDVVKDIVAEVETKQSALQQGLRQVVNSQKPRYLAVNKKNIKNALAVTEGTGVGVMGPTGRIIKKASRKR